MSKIRILAVAGLASMAFAGGNLWDFPNLLDGENCGNYCGQVKAPGVLYCWADAEPPSEENNYGSPCYKQSGGWWFGYGDEGGEVKDAVNGRKVFLPETNCDMAKDPTPTQSEGTIAIEKWIDDKQNVDWKSLTAKSYSKAGHYIVKGFGLGDGTDGFDVKFVNPAGTDKEPTVAAIGFNWRQKEECGNTDYEGHYTEDLTSVKADGKTVEGLCIVYKADEAGVDVELGWNEAVYEYNTWIVKLAAASSWKTIDMKWEDFAPSFQGEDDPYPIETALKEAEALKFSFKNKTSDAKTIHFQLKEVGWFGSCSGTASRPEPPTTPITVGKIASAYKFYMNGRTLSANFAAGSVQVINLQGAVVAKKTLNATDKMNLANLPSGIYMVRSELGIVQKIMVK